MLLNWLSQECRYGSCSMSMRNLWHPKVRTNSVSSPGRGELFVNRPSQFVQKILLLLLPHSLSPSHFSFSILLIPERNKFSPLLPLQLPLLLLLLLLLFLGRILSLLCTLTSWCTLSIAPFSTSVYAKPPPISDKYQKSRVFNKLENSRW